MMTYNNAEPLFSTRDVTTVVSDVDHCEGVNFGPDGSGYAGGEMGQLFKFTPEGDREVVANTGGGIGGVCVDGSGNVYECNYGTARVNRISPDGEVMVYSDQTGSRPNAYPNYAVFDSSGNLYYSDSGDFYTPSGTLFVVRPDGKTEQIAGDEFSFPNGLAIDATESWLYMIQSLASNILRFPLRNGAVGEPELFVSLPGTVPDGLAFSVAGNLYVACYKPDTILRIRPDRTVEIVVDDPFADLVNRPTNVAFVPGTTELMFANFGGTSINKLDVGEPGQALSLPKF